MNELHLFLGLFCIWTWWVYVSHRQNKRFEKEIDELWRAVLKAEDTKE